MSTDVRSARLALPRILAIMGSGETAPTMTRVHRELVSRLDAAVPATIVDTTYGFQENADDITARMVDTFRVSLGRTFTVASYRSRGVDPVDESTAVARIREAGYVMAGPGSPSYALRHWAGGPISAALAEKLANGEIVTMASAAAVTLGVVTVPVYEIYKAGDDPTWLPGLNLLEPATGLRAAVVPHYDNAEGGNHDTRFCYLGERRLRILEAGLPDETFILGVDGHTALVLDLDRGTARVAGIGRVTVRARGRSVVFERDAEVPIEALTVAARSVAAGRAFAVDWAAVAGSEAAIPATDPSAAPVLDAADGVVPDPSLDARAAPASEDLEGEFVDALASNDVRRALVALLDLDLDLEGRLRSGEDSPELDNARARYRALLVRLAESSANPTEGSGAALVPVMETILDLRSEARAAGDWPMADRIRDRLIDAGIEVRDNADGSDWSLVEAAPH